MEIKSWKYVPLSSKLFLIVASLFLSFALLFIFFQYGRERTYNIENLNTRLQDCNCNIHDLLGSDTSALGKYGARLDKENIRITVLDTCGRVIYDSQASDSTAFGNHLGRKEIREALRCGTGYDIKRQSQSVGGKWFYSATAFKEDNLIIRTSHIYDVSLGQMLMSDSGYIWMALALSLVLLFTYYLYVRRIKLNITHLRIFAEMAEKNMDIENADISFSNDELGEISKNIVRLYAQLQNSEDDKTRFKRQLTQNIAHELKTPVSSIRGYLETFLEDPDMDKDTRRDFLERCHAQSIRLDNLISDITLLSKMTDASQSFSTESVNMEQLLADIKKDVEQQLEARRMKFLILVGKDTVVTGNQMLLYSIFRNLTDNAIAYTGEGSTIVVQRLREDKEHFWFSFSDNGPGVPEEHLPHLFERFYRVDKGRSRKLGGTGLGLAIVKNAVILHGGEISVRQARNGGLEFIFSIAKGAE